MKNRLSIICLFLLGGISLAAAQTAQIPTPKNPLLRHMPTFASWTVTYSYVLPTGQSQPALDMPKILTVTKTDKTYREATVFLSGKQSERWIYDGTVLQRGAGSSSIVPVPPPTALSPEPDYPDYTRSDFADLEWLTLQMYQGIQTNGGKPAFSFASGDGPSKSTALLSVPDQRPITATVGGITSVYSYNPPPTAPLTLPPDFMLVLTKHKKGLEALQYHASPP